MIRKEILNNIVSFRFLVSFVLLIVVVSFTVFVLTNDYVRMQDEYSRRQTEIETYLKNYAHFNRVRAIITPSQPPQAFYSLIRGVSAEVNIQSFDDDPLPAMFPLLDLAFIVSILLSLIALLFAYDSICGEKEDGTLKLMVSNCLPKSSVVMGKISGGILTLIVPFLISLAAGLLIILLNSRVTWRGTDWGALGFILLGSILYISFFYVLGTFISTRHHSSSASIMTSLFVWTLLVLVIPNLSPYVASFLSSSPSRIKVGREISRLTSEERDVLGKRLQRQKMQELIKKYPILAENLTLDQRKERMAKDPLVREAFEEATKAIDAAWTEANQVQNEKARILQEELTRKEEQQTRLSAYISMISPLSNFTYLATDLSSTGIRNSIFFRQRTQVWGEDFNDYQRQKLAVLRKDDPSRDWWNTPVDMSDRPKFEYREEALVGRLRWTIPFFGLLVFFNLLFFPIGYFSFIRYDVR